MAIFGNKKKTVIERLDELLAEIDGLPDEEQEKVWAHFDQATGDDKDESGKPDTSEEIEKAEEDIAEKGADSQTEKDRIDESVAAQEEADGEEDSQDAKDRVDEAEGEEKADEAKSVMERIEAIEARLNALEGNDEENEDKEAMDKAKAVYGVDGGTFAPDRNPKRATIEQAKKFAAKYL